MIFKLPKYPLLHRYDGVYGVLSSSQRVYAAIVALFRVSIPREIKPPPMLASQPKSCIFGVPALMPFERARVANTRSLS